MTNVKKNFAGLYNSLINFFTAQYILIHDDSTSAVSDVLSSSDGVEGGIKVVNLLSNADSTAATASMKLPPSFSIVSSLTDLQDLTKYDLSTYRFITNFPADKSSSVEILRKHLIRITEMSQRLMMGGFLVLILPRSSENLDLILSSVEIVTGSLTSMTYNGMIMFEPLQLPVWIFRKEPLNITVISARVNMARKRLRRYLKDFDNLVNDLAPVLPSSDINPLPSEYSSILNTKVTPSHKLADLFEILKGNYPREIINATIPYQSKYSGVLSAISTTATAKSSLLPALNEMLYDFALSISRRHST